MIITVKFNSHVKIVNRSIKIWKNKNDWGLEWMLKCQDSVKWNNQEVMKHLHVFVSKNIF